MSSRDAILGALRAAKAEPVAAPRHPPPVRQGDPVERFLESVKGVGGHPYRVPDVAALAAEVARIGPGAVWLRGRELPEPPRESFAELYDRETTGGQGGKP